MGEKQKKGKKKKTRFWHEFKEFALRGNVLDLAVGIIIGGAFQSIVKSVIDDLVMPIVGMFLNKDFNNLYIPLFDTASYPNLAGAPLADVKAANLPVFAYGSFLTNLLNFLIMAFIIFLLVKGMNRLSHIKLPGILGKEEKEAPAPTTKKCPYCKSEIAIDAVRCPHCTSELTVEEKEAEK